MMSEGIRLSKTDNQLLDGVNNQYDGFVDIANWNNIEKLVNYNLTDAGNAERFRDIAGKNFWWVPERGWFYYDGVKWVLSPEQVELAMIAITRGIMEAALLYFSTSKRDEQMQKVIKHALSSESNSRIKGALEIAKAMLTKHYTEFDKNQLLLCLENGVFDLRVGGEGFRKSRPEDLLHKCTHVKFDPLAECPRWLQFLNEIFMDDEKLILFIQKAIGYTLTGLTSAQCFFILYGTGANGKSVFLTILQLLLGEFAISTSMDTFKDRHQNNAQIPNDLAALCGKRFVKSTELKEGSRLNEERIKTLTGDESIQARFLHKEFFDFFPEFKIWIGVNHKPVIKGTDEAVWRRPKLIPFEAYFPPEKRDENLLNILKSELPGILLWAIDGCYMWQQEGLKLPEKVEKATSEYREESDVIGEFLKECTITGEFKKVKSSDLYAAYEKWCGGEADIYKKPFGLKITERGFIRKYSNGYPYYLGIGLLNNNE
jgi:putative DNA primase/helicase